MLVFQSPVVAAAILAHQSKVSVDGHCILQTNTTHQTNPAIIYVSNQCATTNITMCLEYQGAFHPIRYITPGKSVLLSSQFQDCWAFRAQSCSGTELFQHSVYGSHKFILGCTVHDIDIQRIGIQQDIPIDCTLTTVPLLTDLYAAMKQQFRQNQQNSMGIKFLKVLDNMDISQPLTIVDRKQFLTTIYAHAVSLARHGVDIHDSLIILQHARALILHTERCKPYLVGSHIALPSSYIALYGIMTGMIRARAVQNNIWVSTVAMLTEQQENLLIALQDMVAGTTFTAGKLPQNLIPPTELLDIYSSNTTRMVKTVTIKQILSVGHTAVKMEQQGVEYCAQYGDNWIFWREDKSTEEDFIETDCCHDVCMIMKSISSVSAFVKLSTSNCCVCCNKGWCIFEEIKQHPYLQAIFQAAEIQISAQYGDVSDEDTVTLTI